MNTPEQELYDFLLSVLKTGDSLYPLRKLVRQRGKETISELNLLHKQGRVERKEIEGIVFVKIKKMEL